VGDLLGGVLGLGALFTVVWLIVKAQAGASRAVNRAVFRSKHEQGQDQVSRTMSIKSAGNQTQTMNAIVSRVNAYQEPPTLVPGLYLASRRTDYVVIRYGSKVSDSFEATVSLTDAGDEGCFGQFLITKWTESDGLVANVDQMTRLRDRITHAISDVS
jgi:hypothetical protein